jgi:hypothetical protein
MRNNSIHLRTRISLIDLAALLGAAAAIGILFWLSQGGSAPRWLAAAILGPAAVLGIFWQLRARATRRWQAVLDTFAEREMIRTKHHNGVPAQFEAMSRTVRRVHSRRKLHACSQSQDR